MKRIKIIVAAILRGALLIAPGTAFAVWQWGKVAALVNILAAVGLETLFLLVFSFFTVAFDEARKRSASDKEQTNSESGTNTTDVML